MKEMMEVQDLYQKKVDSLSINNDALLRSNLTITTTLKARTI